MPRIKLDLPSDFIFSTEVPLRISDINYNDHLGNDAVLSIIHESRVRFFHHHGWTELDVDGVGIIMADAVILFKSESFYGDVLRIDIAVADLDRIGCDLLYRLTDVKSGREVARAKTGIVFYDYSARKPVPIPESFRSRFQPKNQ